MRKVILLGSVVAALIIVTTAVAVAAQPSQGNTPQDEWFGTPGDMHGWMTDNWDEMPMFGGPDVEGDDEWFGTHEEMHGWMTDNWDEMPMWGEVPDSWSDPASADRAGWCHGSGSRA